MRTLALNLVALLFAGPSGALDAWDPVDDTYEGATDLGTPTIELQEHGEHTAHQHLKDWFRFFLMAGLTYEFASTGDRGSNDRILTAELFIPDFTSLTRVGQSSGGGLDNNFRLTYVPESSGVYYLSIIKNGYGSGLETHYYLRYIQHPDPNATPTPVVTPTPTLIPVESAFELEVLRDGFVAEPIVTLRRPVPPLEYNVVAGADGDLVILEEANDHRHHLVWYNGADTVTVARAELNVDVRGIVPAGQNAILVVIHNRNEDKWRVYRLTGPFNPVGVRAFLRH